jgi:hypothetical protein
MPKIFIPSDILVDNGIKTTPNYPNNSLNAVNQDDLTEDLFNWEVVSYKTPIDAGATVNVGTADTGMYQYASVGAEPGSMYAIQKFKDDEQKSCRVTWKLEEPLNAPTGNWETNNQLVGTGAFCLMLNVTPNRPGTTDPANAKDNPWLITLVMGDIEMTINDTGSMQVKLAGDVQGNTGTVQLSQGKAQGGPPQQKHMDEKTPYIILVYPVWNGVIVSSGVMDTRAVVQTTSTYVPKYKDAAIFVGYSSGFDPTSPSDVEVAVSGTGLNNVMTDFGTQIDATLDNCRVELAYLPCFFTKEMGFDEWFITTDDVAGDVNYTYSVYKIWTKNGTATTLPTPIVTELSSAVGSIAGTHYSYAQWRMSQVQPNRVGGQLFGSILEVEEDKVWNFVNGNGNFFLNWDVASGTPGDTGPTARGPWQDYITSVSVTIGLDGTSGSISVDKYGLAGQTAEVEQVIGGLQLYASGGDGTVAGKIFSGLAMGVSDARSSDGATWTIPLVGLEKKLEDIALINVPFFDGESVSTAFSFLSSYAGIEPINLSTNPFLKLSSSTDINVARFDWKSGTNVKTALDEVMDDTLHTYVVDGTLGQIFLYAIDAGTSMPDFANAIVSGNYSQTNIVTDDKAPDFEDLRNEIVVIGLEQIPEGQNTDIEDIPIFPRIATVGNATNPVVAWSKSMVQPISGFLTNAELNTIAGRLADRTRVYEEMGRVTIPGNASIHLYDRWLLGGVTRRVISITHNVDLVGKSWTTDLELQKDYVPPP